MPKLSKVDLAAKVSKTEADRRRAVALARYRELQTGELEGKLVRLCEVELLWSRILANCRSRILAIPSRLAQVLPVDEAARREAAAAAMEVIREALTELADTTERIDLDAPPEPEAEPAPEPAPAPKGRPAKGK